MGFRSYGAFYVEACRIFGALRSTYAKPGAGGLDAYGWYIRSWARFLMANTLPSLSLSAPLTASMMNEEYLSRRFYITYVMPLSRCTRGSDMFLDFELVQGRCALRDSGPSSSRTCSNAFAPPAWTPLRNDPVSAQFNKLELDALNRDMLSNLLPSVPRGGGRKKTKKNKS